MKLELNLDWWTDVMLNAFCQNMENIPYRDDWGGTGRYLHVHVILDPCKVPVILDYTPAVTWLQANIPAVTQRVPVTGPFSPTVQRWARIIWAIIRAVIRQASNFRFQRYNHLLAITVWHPSILLIAKPDCSRLVYLISKWLPRWYKTAGPITLLPFILLWVFCQVMSAQFPVAIVGIGCRLPGGSDTKELYYEFLRNKVSII